MGKPSVILVTSLSDFFSWFVMRISSCSIYFGLFLCSCFVEMFSFTIYRGLFSCTDLFILLISQLYHVAFMLQCTNWSFRSFGRFTLVGTHTINSIHKFLYNPVTRFVWKEILNQIIFWVFFLVFCPCSFECFFWKSYELRFIHRIRN